MSSSQYDNGWFEKQYRNKTKQPSATKGKYVTKGADIVRYLIYSSTLAMTYELAQEPSQASACR
jgi:hypothetical protein